MKLCSREKPLIWTILNTSSGGCNIKGNTVCSKFSQTLFCLSVPAINILSESESISLTIVTVSYTTTSSGHKAQGTRCMHTPPHPEADKCHGVALEYSSGPIFCTMQFGYMLFSEGMDIILLPCNVYLCQSSPLVRYGRTNWRQLMKCCARPQRGS